MFKERDWEGLGEGRECIRVVLSFGRREVRGRLYLCDMCRNFVFVKMFFFRN